MPLPEHELVATASTVVYRNRWIAVHEDKTLRHDGVEGIYGVVDAADFALILPYTDGGFYLVEQYRYTVKGRYWEFPGGSWEAQPDADPLDVARGELAEETGLTAGTMTSLGHLYQAYGISGQGFHMFLATDLTVGEPDLEETEAGLVSRWFSEAEVWQLIDEGRFKDAPSIAALACFQRHRAKEDARGTVNSEPVEPGVARVDAGE
ncbi:NUDIX domain-containing protein [Actinospica robiniae]|uniref:NUDIX domain-containing protein n=1 Tax=Actinospica robiniae TaxID=304901 RepID=UPI000420ACF4|nr:NUDIX hydrolase [Actinospica robiniae]